MSGGWLIFGFDSCLRIRERHKLSLSCGFLSTANMPEPEKVLGGPGRGRAERRARVSSCAIGEHLRLPGCQFLTQKAQAGLAFATSLAPPCCKPESSRLLWSMSHSGTHKLIALFSKHFLLVKIPGSLSAISEAGHSCCL